MPIASSWLLLSRSASISHYHSQDEWSCFQSLSAKSFRMYYHPYQPKSPTGAPEKLGFRAGSWVGPPISPITVNLPNISPTNIFMLSWEVFKLVFFGRACIVARSIIVSSLEWMKCVQAIMVEPRGIKSGWQCHVGAGSWSFGWFRSGMISVRISMLNTSNPQDPSTKQRKSAHYVKSILSRDHDQWLIYKTICVFSYGRNLFISNYRLDKLVPYLQRGLQFFCSEDIS